MAMRVSFKRNINIGRTVAKIVGAVIALYVGGTIVVELGNVMNGTYSPFYRGLSLIGWTVSSSAVTCGTASGTHTNCITATSGTGILTVIGIIAIAAIVMEFVNFSF